MTKGDVDCIYKGLSSVAGFGVFAKRDISSRRVVGEYTGVKRRLDYDGCTEYALANGHGFLIDALPDPDRADSDGGNLLRLINHAGPGATNCTFNNLYADGRMYLITSCKIVTGQELFVDYGSNYWKIPNRVKLRRSARIAKKKKC